MEAMAVGVGKSVLMGVLGYGGSKAEEEIALQTGVEDDCAFIAAELEMIQSFLLMTAGEERGENKVLITWVKHVRNLALVAEDSLKDFSLLSEKKSRWRRPQNMVERRRIAMEMKKLKARVEEVSSRNLRYRHINESSTSKPVAAEEQAGIATVAMFGSNEARFAAFLGHEKSSELDLRQLITSDAVDLRVVSVCGTSSELGKMSAIKEVYDDPLVLKRFGFIAWIRLTHPFSPQEFLRSLVRQFYENSHDEIEKAEQETSVGANVLAKMEMMDLSGLIHEFNTQLCLNSYLIVVDDLSTIVEWHSVKKYFPDNKKRSRIIVSTQQVEIASLCTGSPYQFSKLKQFSYDQTIYLFHKNSEEQSSMGSVSRAMFDTSEATIAAMKDKLKLDGEELIKLVGQQDDYQGFKVISIYGRRGLGKTTLVRSIYRSQQLGGWRCAWATILRPFNREVVLRDLAMQLQNTIQEDDVGSTSTQAQKRNITMMNLQELQENIAQALTRETFLVVLDDISSTSEWDSIISCLNRARTIIVTTSQENITKHCSTAYENMYRPEGLKDDVALDLFMKKVSKGNIEKNDLVPAMMDQARLIVQKCDGLPLAILTIGGLLATKPKTATEWRKMNTELDKNPEDTIVKTIFMRSYDGLPDHLKSVLLYLSIFLEDHIIRWGRLVRRWIAEGYSRDMHGMTAVELCRRYFEELLDRNMILAVEGIDHYNQKINSCQLHDIMREVCISKAREQNLVFTLEEGCHLSNARGGMRHLVIGSNWTRDKYVLKNIPDLSHIRSLTVFGEWRSFFLSKDMRFLRVLDLQGTLGLRDHHLDQIGQLHHLIYLSLRGCSSILYLPDSMKNLRQLQTLDVRGTNIFALPTRITNLQKLQYLRADGYLDREPDIKVEDDIVAKYSGYIDRTSTSQTCNILLSSGHLFLRPHVLDAGLSRYDMRNLHRFLKVKPGLGVILPRGIGKLKTLHTLGYVNVSGSNGKTTLKELGELTQLRKLRVFGISYRNSNLFWSAIAGHNELQSLAVCQERWDGEGIPLDDRLGYGLLPPCSLKSLTLFGNLRNVPEWIHILQNLSKLVLMNCTLEGDAIEAIGLLPNLAVLRLSGLDGSGPELYFKSSSFPNLMLLELTDLYKLRMVVFEKDTMPKLELLRVCWCRSLDDIIGLPSLTSLKDICLVGYMNEYVRWAVQRQAAEHGRVNIVDKAGGPVGAI